MSRLLAFSFHMTDRVFCFRQVAAFKYRYQNRQGVMEDAPPTLSSSVRQMAGPNTHKFRCE